MKIYMAVENSKEELPIAVAESQKELAEMIGGTLGYVNKLVKGKYKQLGRAKIKIITIDVDSDKDLT